MSIRILVVDDHVTFRDGVAQFLTTLDGRYEIVAGVGSSEEAIARIATLKPDIVLTDIELPGENGIEATRRIRRTWPHIAVIVMSNHAVEVYRQAALDAGAVGFVDKMELARVLPIVLTMAGEGAPAPDHASDDAPGWTSAGARRGRGAA